MSFENPEVLEVGRGDAMPPSAESVKRRRSLVVGAGVTAGVLALGAAAWGVYSFVSTGPQPAQALPASTLAYAALDLDPSGPQKIEAYKFLRKFPAVRDQLDLDTDDDLRRAWFEGLVEASGCSSLDYEDDVAPWLGSRAAVAAVDLGGETPTPVVAIQVTDEDAARNGLDEVRRCLVGSPVDLGGDYGVESDEQTAERLGWAIEGDWAILAESADEARQVVEATAAADLADDPEFASWMSEVGTPGIMTFYAAPEAGQALLDVYGGQLDQLAGLGGDVTGQVGGADFQEEWDAACQDPTSSACEDFLDTWDQGVQMTAVDPADPVELPAEVKEMFEDFSGAAATISFDDGALQLSAAFDAGLTHDLAGGEDAGELAGNLPESTIAALAWSMPDGWADELLDSSGMADDSTLSELESQLGVSIPEDLTTLAGDRLAVALGGPVDESMFDGGMDDVPLGVVVDGDADAIRDVLDRIALNAPPSEASWFETSAEGDLVAAAGSSSWRDALVEDGDLAGSDTYQRVVRDGDADSVVFVDFDGSNDWLVTLAGDDEDATANLAPLDAFGATTWTDDDVLHSVWRLTTD